MARGAECPTCRAKGVERQKAYRARKDAMTCRDCSQPSGGTALCSTCNQRNLTRSRELYRSRKAKGLCTYCGEPATNGGFCATCSEKSLNRRYPAKHLNYLTRRETVFNHYGRSCTCCGESEQLFLTIDHTADDGAAHRKAVPSSAFYQWLVNHHFPAGFQTLCYNCNCGRARNSGVCPHKIRPTNGT